ncbi:hypothetical protein [Nannocystis radixulma]|uniref:Lipoprotein n=1 Tax=Nannocystis radixulma TaxID=2995305 RepID=A0ABT5BGD8_9BACT|nr:hypothetical protein [Nannocystis radixulma]MDC0672614.1 hypothetical protein [Nannocystis radixulma]
MLSAMRALGLSCLFLTACGDIEDEAESIGVLDLETQASGLAGTYTLGDASLRFTSREVESGIVDVVVSVHGLELTAIVDTLSRVAEIDGFAAGGAETQIVARDRELLAAFVAALADEVDVEASLAASTLHRVSSSWSQTPDTVPLQRSVAAQERGWSSICSSYNKYLTATHDDSNYDAFSPNSSSYAHVGHRAASTYYHVNNKWTTTVQDHKAYLYEYGACYGNCGSGCPGGSQTLTLDCLDHDQCVRNGHALASLWCDDEFVSASDDEFFAPKCSGT